MPVNLAGTGDQILQAVKRTPGNIAGGPVDIVNLLAGLMAGKGVEGLSKEPVGGSDWINRQFGMKSKGGGVQQVAEMVAGSVSPSGAAKAVILPAAAILRDFKTYNKINKALPQYTAADPVVAADIFKRTGVWRDPIDFELKAVLPDTDAKIKPKVLEREEAHTSWSMESRPEQRVNIQGSIFTKPVPLQDVLDHPELFKAFPELADTKVTRGFLTGHDEAAYNPHFDNIFMGSSSGEQKWLSNLLHEVQHAIQHKSAFASGGNPEMFFDNKKRFDAARDAARAAVNDRFKDFEHLANAQGFKNFSRYYIPKKVEAALANTPEYKAFRAAEADDAKMLAVSQEPFGLYQRLSGENEARMVSEMLQQGRYDLSPQDFTKFVEARRAAGWSTENLFPVSELTYNPQRYIDLEQPIADLINKLLANPKP
jgi:hypothetical protein